MPDDDIKTASHGKANRAVRDRHESLGDFTTTWRDREAVRTLKKISFLHIRRRPVKGTNHGLKPPDNAYYLRREGYR